MKNKVLIFFGIVSFSIINLAKGQVSLQNGTPDITIPLYSISDASNGLGTSVNLNYVGGNGIKVDGMASPVGTGWEIMAGGSITRITNGEPDDQKQNGTFSPYTSPTIAPSTIFNPPPPTNQQSFLQRQYVDNYYPNGYLYSEFDPTISVTNGGAYQFLGQGLHKDLPDPKFIADREMDVFQFEFNGRNGTFSIAKTQSKKDVIVHNIKDSKLQIEIEYDENAINSSIRTTINKISITDETGIKYVFEEMELTEAVKYEKRVTYSLGSNTPNNIVFYSYSSSLSVTNDIPIMEGVGTGQYVCNKWMLTKIINPLTNKSIEFSYQTAIVNMPGPHNVSSFSYGTKNSTSVVINLISQKFKRIKSISNEYGDKIDFQYSIDREDVPGDKILESISIQKNNQEISRYNFEHGYFFKQTIRDISDVFLNSEISFLRLCLKEVQKVGMNDEKDAPYKFEYETNPSNPLAIYPPAFCFFKDHWGYFNSHGNRPPNIINNYVPETGKPYSNQFYTEALDNNYSQVKNICTSSINLAATGLVTSLTYPLGGKINYEYEQNQQTATNGIDKEVGGVRVHKIKIKDANSLVDKEIEYKYVLDNQKSSAWGYEEPIYNESKTLHMMRCSNGQMYSPISGLASTTLNSLEVTHAGTSILKINPSTLVISIALQIFLPALLDLFASDYEDFNVALSYTDPINFNNPLPMMYSRVEVKNVTQNVNSGKDIYEFTSPTQYPLERLVQSDPYSAAQRYAPWKYGLLLSETNKDINGDKRKVEYKYDVSPLQLNFSSSSSLISQKWKVKDIQSTCGRLFDDIGTDWILSEFYEPFIGKIDLLQKDESLYTEAGNSLKKTINFDYDNILTPNSFIFPKSQYTYNSNGEKIETINKLVQNYNIAGVISTLKQSSINNISTPVLTETYIYKGGVKKLMTGSILEYGVLQNGNIKPVKTYSLKTDRPIDDNLLLPFSPTQLIRDPAYYKPTAEMIYDADGNLVQTNKLEVVNNVVNTPSKNSLIYDKSNPQLIIATAENSAREDIAYTSFETPMDNVTNWSYNESLLSSTEWITGKKCIALDGDIRSISRQNLNAGIKYKVSFWAKNVNGSHFVPGVNKNNEVNSFDILINITPSKVYTNPTTQWSLYECYITNATSININNQDGPNGVQGVPILIDEIRLYPEGASMATSTYNIQGLPTSKTGANNTVQYMEYDGLGRLRLIRDEEKNILKTYEYNYKQ